MSHQAVLGTEPVGKLLLKYSIPAIIGMLVNALYNVVDRMFIGNIPEVGPLAITGVGITLPIVTIIMAFGMLVGIGSAANMSIKLGQQKRDQAEKIVGNALTLCFLVSIFIMIVGLAFKDQILVMFGASENTLIYAEKYITIILFGTLFNVTGFAMNSTIRSDGSPKIAALTMIIGCLLNVILDPIFIFGFKWGIEGAALATIISQAVTTIWVLSYYTVGKSNLKLKKNNLKLDMKLVKLIFAIGSAPFAMQIAASFVQVMSNNALKMHGGDLAIGAMASISAVSMIFLMPIFGINQGSQPIIGYNFGAKKYHRANQTFLYAMISALCILTVGFIIVQWVPEYILRLFNGDEQMLAIAINGIRIYLFMLPAVAISVTGSNYFQSVGKAKVAMFLSLLRQLILLLPLILILPPVFGLNGVWLAQPVADFIAVLVTAFFLLKEFRATKKLGDLEDVILTQEERNVEIN
ncbi:MAG: MATE family efflux transporter [Turicibacter sp.]